MLSTKCDAHHKLFYVVGLFHQEEAYLGEQARWKVCGEVTVYLES